jgi:hypothetical protein
MRSSKAPLKKTEAARSRNWLWLLQKGSSVAPAVYEDQQKISLDQSPFVTGGGYLRTEANAYLTKQLKQIDIRLNTEGRIITIVPHAAINALQILYQSSILKVPHTHLSRMMSEIRTAAHDNKVI